MQYDVTASGTVDNAKLSSSSGSAHLDEATIAFVTGFKFKPALDGKTPAACHNSLTVTWSLHDTEDELAAQGITPLYPTSADYPLGAIQRNEVDTVLVIVSLEKSGGVETAVLAHPGKYADLNEASLAYLRTQKFKPGEVNGAPAKSFIVTAVVWGPAPPATPKPLQTPEKK